MIESRERQRFSPRPIFLLALIILLGLALRVVQLDFQPLWWDEGYSVFFATRDFGTMLARTAVDIHPPLYYVLLQVWIPLLGASSGALRLLSVAIGVAAIPLIYVVGAQLSAVKPATPQGTQVGLIAAFLLAIAPLHVYYSQELRMYGLITLLALASIALQIHLLNAPASRHIAAWVGYILVTAAALYSQYYAAFLVAAEIAVVLWLRRRERQRLEVRGWIAAWLAMLLLYLPWLVYAGLKLYVYVSAKVGIEQYSRLDPLTFLVQHLTAFSVGHLSSLTWLGWGALPVAALAAFGFLSRSRISNPPKELRPALLISLYFAVPLFLGYLVGLVYTFHPIRYERLLLFAAPPFYLLVALGLDALLQRRALWAYGALTALTIICAASLYDFYTVPRYPDEDYRPLVRQMEALAQPGDIVLALYPWQIGYLEAYYHGAPLHLTEVPTEAWISQPAQMEEAVNSLRASGARIWLPAYQMQGHILEDELANFFANEYSLDDEWFGNTRLEYYAPGTDPPLNEVALEFAPDLKLLSHGVGSDPVRAGVGFVPVHLHWQAGSSRYSYSLRLVAGTGETSLQLDQPIPASDQIVRRGLFVPRTVAPGQYALRLLVYHGADGSPVPAPNGQDAIELGQVVVTAAP